MSPNTSSAIYDIHKDFTENVVYGPFFSGKLPEFPKSSSAAPSALQNSKVSQQNSKFSLFGHSLNSPIGVSASPMTFTSRNIELCSRLGYDVITYRSVRSVEWHGLKAPNWVYVDIPGQLTKADLAKPVIGSLEPFAGQGSQVGQDGSHDQAGQDVTTANSFGIQSFKPEYWQREYEVAKSRLQPGQLLILALMITPEDGTRDAVADAREVAKLANETSAEVFEINLACPNSGSSALIYEDCPLSKEVCVAIKEVIGDKPLVAKVGYYSDFANMKNFLAETKGVLSGMTSTNTYNMKVTDAAGKEIFPGRGNGGVSGAAIRNLSQEQAKELVRLRQELDLKNFAIIANGGVTKPEHFQEYLDLGADVVQTAAGLWADPYLAAKFKKITM